MINVIICDNDTKYVEIERKVIQETADRRQEEIWIDAYPNEERFFESLKQREDNSLCILLLNIDILEHKNYNMVKMFNKQYPEIIVLFVSSREELVFQSFEYKPFWFVRRGMVEDELHHVVERAFEELERRVEKQTVVKCSEGRVYLAHKDILYLEIVHRKVFIYLTQERVLKVRGTLKGLLEKLNDGKLIQVNSGCAVNVDWIESYTKDAVVLKNGKRLSVSRDRAKKVKLQIRENWREE